MENNTCPNCGNEVIGKYCHHCGQKEGVNRLTWRVIFDDLQKRLFGFDNNFFRTVKDLTIHPGKVIQSTITGIRVRYIGPVGYYFLTVTIFVLLISILDIDMAVYTKDIVETMTADDATEDQIALQTKVNGFVYGNFRLTSFLMIPFFIAGVWLIFKNKKYNFLESSVVVFYAQAQSVFLSIFALLAYKFFDFSHAMVYIVPISYGYMAFVYADFYKGNAIWNFIKGLLSILLSFIFLILISMIVGIVIAIVNPELIKPV